MYCNLESISILPLLSSIQYHTGIKFKNELGGLLDKIINKKYGRTIFEEFSLSPKICYSNFSYFFVKKKQFYLCLIILGCIILEEKYIIKQN